MNSLFLFVVINTDQAVHCDQVLFECNHFAQFFAVAELVLLDFVIAEDFFD